MSKTGKALLAKLPRVLVAASLGKVVGVMLKNCGHLGFEVLSTQGSEISSRH